MNEDDFMHGRAAASVLGVATAAIDTVNELEGQCKLYVLSKGYWRDLEAVEALLIASRGANLDASMLLYQFKMDFGDFRKSQSRNPLCSSTVTTLQTFSCCPRACWSSWATDTYAPKIIDSRHVLAASKSHTLQTFLYHSLASSNCSDMKCEMLFCIVLRWKNGIRREMTIPPDF